MADQSKVLEHYPATADFKVNDLIRTRGDVLCYRSNLQRSSFSTDERGFRHSTLQGKTMSVVDCLQSDRYGIVLGASNIFASGVAGNENCMASRLADRFGFPFINAAMPGGNSRNLNALLFGLVAGAAKRPAAVVLSNGGDLANFCESGMADPIFGSPNRLQVRVHREAGITADADLHLPALLAFTSMWTTATARRCQRYKAPLVMVHQSTFFEKAKPSPIERKCALGEPANERQAPVFDRFKKYNAAFFAKRKEIAERLKVPLAGLGLADRLDFIDEFHCTRESIDLLSQSVGDEIEKLLGSAGPEPKKPSKTKKKSA
jgi:hypothetical protein